MSHASRRVKPPSIKQQQQQQIYSAVPQSPRSLSHANANANNTPYSPPPLSVSQRTTTRNSTPYMSRQPTPAIVKEETAQGVQTGAIGGGYGPYSYQPAPSRDAGMYREGRFSAPPSEHSSATGHEKGVAPTTSTVPAYLWDQKDPDLDDPLHNPDPIRDAALDRSFTLCSLRGWLNASAILVVVGGLLTLFVCYPIIAWYHRTVLQIPGFNLGGNGTGQIPELINFPSLVDKETPQEAYSKTGANGDEYRLVFSDEFNTDGRTFYPGDDPYWEAVDLHYWPTGDLEWYDPSSVTTQGGKLVITITEQQSHDLNFQSGMLTSWNKFCFTTGIIEVSVSLPGDGETPGFWPAAWTMGNLGRAGYGATTEGMWPYTYDTCDGGTYPNQTDKNGNPAAALTGGNNGGPLSFLPGQRVSACTCPESDHPGPNVGVGRGVPEIDIFEAQIDTVKRNGEISQSYQIAPYDIGYNYNNETPATTLYDTSSTFFNNYKGGVYQQALSAVTMIDNANYGGGGYGVYGFEWWSDPKHRDQGYITWTSGGAPTWTITSGSLGADSAAKISQRLISEEPHYIIFNLGMAPSFQAQDFKNLKFPSTMYIDWVRVYQKTGVNNIGCDPSNYPTTDYINKHMNAYTDANLTTWAQANYTFPRNSMYDGC